MKYEKNTLFHIINAIRIMDMGLLFRRDKDSMDQALNHMVRLIVIVTVCNAINFSFTMDGL